MQLDFEHVLQSLVDGVAVVDAAGRVSSFNAALEEVSGIAATRALGQPLTLVFEDNPQVAELCARAVKLEQAHVELETTLARRQAPPLPVGISASPVRDAGGRVVGVSVVIRDLRLLHDLKAQVQRAATLNQLGALAAGMAHEIKNPLAGIRGAAQLLKAEAGQSAFSEHTAVILREVDRINGLVEQLMDSARPRALNVKTVNIHEVLDAVIALESSIAERPPIAWVKRYDPSLPELRADPDQLHQLALNLVRNAAEALETGGSIRVSTSIASFQRRMPETDAQPATQLESMVAVSVSDDGPGVAPELQAQIFTPFFTTKERGSGLGLMMAQQIVERHDGFLKLDSAPGRGATFTVTLPLDGPRQRPTPIPGDLP